MNGYKKTVWYCYIGYIVQAIVNNLLPLFFVIFRDQFGISTKKLAFLVLINFVTQIFIDLLLSEIGNKIGYRISLIFAHIFACLGLIGIYLLPKLLNDIYLGLIISTLLFATGGATIEVMVSPVLDGMHLDENGAAMSLLHSFYCWGQVLVVAVTTAAVMLFGKQNWFYIPLFWAIVPFVNGFTFIKAKLPPMLAEEKRVPLKTLFKNKVFVILVLLMVSAGASELAMSQWASYFAEKGLGISKALGDISGPCLFAVLMGISRVVYGIYGNKINLKKFMLVCSVLCVGCYIVTGVAKNAVISLISCALCGFSVGLMWPGTLSLAGKNFAGGTAMFGILALSGDVGCSVGPYVTGLISDCVENCPALINFGKNAGYLKEQLPIKAGLLCSLVFPAITVSAITIWYYIDKRHKKI